MKIDHKDLRYWPILSHFPQSFMENIRLVYVWGNSGSDVLLCTNDDKLLVYGFYSRYNLGKIINSGYGDVSGLAEIEELSEKRIKGFASSMRESVITEKLFVLSYLESGEVYLWGNNPSNYHSFIASPILIDNLPKTVSEVACGVQHVLALTSDGEVYAWGNNHYWQVEYSDRSSAPVQQPKKVESRYFYNKSVSEISCGAYFSVVINSVGQVFSWGRNGNGQLGINKVSDHEFVPQQIRLLQDVRVKKIACGSDHVLALDDQNHLFSWGSNVYQQLGVKRLDNNLLCISVPFKSVHFPKFKDIAADGNLSVGLNFNGDVNVWGKIAGKNYSYPMETPCRTINDAFALFGYGVMHKATAPTFQSENISETIRKSFGNQEFSDFQIKIDNKEIYLHKLILKQRSEYFKGMFEGDWAENNECCLELDENYFAMFAFLKYLYTDELDIKASYAADLIMILDKYGESHLVDRYRQSFEKSVTVNNVAGIYDLTRKLELSNLNEVCVNFFCHHIREITSSEEFDNWNPDTMKNLFREAKIMNLLGA